jgi:hypothetical protein
LICSSLTFACSFDYPSTSAREDGKSALTKAQIEAVATSRTTPFQGTLWLNENNRAHVSVPTLAWGVHEMLRRLLADTVQAIKAEQTMKEVRDGP